MSKKLEVLKYMKAKVTEGRYIQSVYAAKKENEEKCEYCVIGHGLHKLGVTDEELLRLSDYDEATSSTIELIALDDEDENRKQQLDEKRIPLYNKIRDVITEAGFCIDELNGLQLANDTLTTDELNKCLDYYIEEERDRLEKT